MIALWFGSGDHADCFDSQIARGEQPIDMLFHCIAHKRAPTLTINLNPRDRWHAPSVAQIKELFAVYKAHRQWMQKRTVLKDGAGVLWESADGPRLLFSFREQPSRENWVEASSGKKVGTARLQPNKVYRSC